MVLRRNIVVTILLGLASAAIALAQTDSPPGRVALPSARIVLDWKYAPHPPSVLSVSPGTVQFAETTVGAAVSRDVRLANTGREILIGTVESRGDFRIVANAPYVLAPGEARSFAVEFVPRKPGEHSGYLIFRGEHGAVSLLNGTAVAAPTIARPAAAVVPEILALGGGTSFLLRWQSEPGRDYQVWFSEDLVHWTRAGNPAAANGTTMSFHDDGSVIALPPVAAQSRFYRVGDSGGIVGFRRVQLAGSDTPLSVPFLKAIVAQGSIDGVNTCSIADTGAALRPGQFRFDAAGAAETYALTISSGTQAGRWFLITDNDAQTITVEDAEGNCALLQPGDKYIVHPLQRIADVFGPPNDPSLGRDDQIFLWDVASQSYDAPITLGHSSADNRDAWVQGVDVADAVPLLPGEGMLVKRGGGGRRELLLLGAVSPVPTLQPISPGNNLVGQPWPVPLRVAGSDLLSSGFAGAPTFNAADKLYLLNGKRSGFKTVLWFNTALKRWLSPEGNVRPMQVELPPCSALFIQRNRVSGFEWLQKPPAAHASE